MKRSIPTRASVALAAFATLPFAPQALAVPITYEFSTGTIAAYPGPPGTSPGLAEALNGYSVSGTFVYDSEVPSSGNVSIPPSLTGVSPYPGAITGLQGSIAGFSFADPTGAAVVGDEGYSTSISPPSDFLNLAVNGPGATPADFSGFSLLGHDLLNVRLFWIEGSLLPEAVPDFLAADALPSVLPSFNGRLAFDFGIDNALLANNRGTVFIDNLRVRPVSVPEPGTLGLLTMGGALLWVRRRSKST
jgi:hypothetical protein